jgi:hypothetical protein
LVMNPSIKMAVSEGLFGASTSALRGRHRFALAFKMAKPFCHTHPISRVLILQYFHLYQRTLRTL